jgi:hypothetical protein
MKRHSLLGVLFFLCLSFTGQAQQTSDLVYDSFNQMFLNPNKWATSSPCFTQSVLECVREIRNGELRLAVRGYGAKDSNVGSQYGESELHFIKPASVRSIASQLVVQRTNALSCATNLDSAHAHALIAGRFFNSGSAVADDDMEAFLIFDHSSGDPIGVLSVGAFMHWHGQFFGDVSLPPAKVGQQIIAQLRWDQPNHQFVASWTDVRTGVVAQALMPYLISDTTPPVSSDKLLGVRAFTPNCLDTKFRSVDMDAAFDDVTIRH